MNISKNIISFVVACALFTQIFTLNLLASEDLKVNSSVISYNSEEINDADNKIITQNSVYASVGSIDKLPIGDVDGNGTVNSLDYANMRMHLLGMIKDFKPDDELWVSDVNGDDIFNSIDFAFMRQFLLGMIKEFPKQKLVENPTPIPEPTHTYVKPDFKVERIEIAQIRDINSISFKFGVTIKNIGADMLDYIPLMTKVDICNSDNTPVSDISIPTQSQTVLLSRNEEVILSFVSDCLKKGNYKITVMADNSNEVDEEDETNNWFVEYLDIGLDENIMLSSIEIKSGDKISGKIDCVGDFHYFAFMPLKTAIYIITTEVFGGSIVQSIYDYKDENFSGSEIIDSEKSNYPIKQGRYGGKTYYLAIGQKNNLAEYSISISEMQDDHGNDFETATSLDDGPSEGLIESSGDVDFFSFFAPNLGNYIITTSTFMDMDYCVYDSYGNELFKDIPGKNSVLNKSFEISFEGNKTYYIKVKPTVLEHLGAYDISVSPK